MDQQPVASESNSPSADAPRPRTFIQTDDFWAIAVGGFLLAVCLVAVLATNSADVEKVSSPLKPWLTSPGSWESNPLDAFAGTPPNLLKSQWESVFGYVKIGDDEKLFLGKIPGILGFFLISLLTFSAATSAMGDRFAEFAKAFTVVFLLGIIAYIMAGQAVVKYYNLAYALWALVAGLLISNTIGTPQWLRPAIRTELFIKTGLVILGAEVLFSRLLELGIPGIFVAWIVTPVVLITTFWFGQKILKIESPSLNMVIAADMSVCGVSAAIATAAACKAKKEELSLAIGLSLSFTVVMMIVMPAIIQSVGMSNVLGGAWIGGTIDATGAVAAAGTMLGEDALEVAAAVKMIQNILIGVVAFFVAVFWVFYVENDPNAAKPSPIEIWKRFPKFILGFIAASILFSIIYAVAENGHGVVNAVTKESTKALRGWFFCLAFVSIGLETNFKELAKFLKGGKPLVLYVVGQTFNLCLTLFMAWLMFEKVFPQAAEVLKK